MVATAVPLIGDGVPEGWLVAQGLQDSSVDLGDMLNPSMYFGGIEELSAVVGVRWMSAEAQKTVNHRVLAGDSRTSCLRIVTGKAGE